MGARLCMWLTGATPISVASGTKPSRISPHASRSTSESSISMFFNHPMFGGPHGPSTMWGYCYSTPCTGHQLPDFGKISAALRNAQPGTGRQRIAGRQSALYATGGPRSR